jgi:hypothetical protein
MFLWILSKNKRDNIKFIKNKEIMDNIKLKDVPELKKMIIKTHKKSESKLDLEKILRSYKNAINENILLKRLFKLLFVKLR